MLSQFESTNNSSGIIVFRGSYLSKVEIIFSVYVRIGEILRKLFDATCPLTFGSIPSHKTIFIRIKYSPAEGPFFASTKQGFSHGTGTRNLCPQSTRPFDPGRNGEILDVPVPDRFPTLH